MKKFPYEIATKSGDIAIVTNPEEGHYHFEIESLKKSFEHYGASYKGVVKGNSAKAVVDDIEEEVIDIFNREFK